MDKWYLIYFITLICGSFVFEAIAFLITSHLPCVQREINTKLIWDSFETINLTTFIIVQFVDTFIVSLEICYKGN